MVNKCKFTFCLIDDSVQVDSNARIFFRTGLQSFMKFRKTPSLIAAMLFVAILTIQAQTLPRSEERRVGKECRL